MRAIRAPGNLFVEVLWKSRNRVLLDLPVNNQYSPIVKSLTMIHLCIVEDIPDVGRIAGAENPAFSGFSTLKTQISMQLN